MPIDLVKYAQDNNILGSTGVARPVSSAQSALDATLRSAESAARYSPNRVDLLEYSRGLAAGEQKKPGGFAGIVGGILSLPGIKQVLAPLSILDVPRRAVISAGKEIWDVFGEGDASWSDFTKQVKDPTFGFGRFVDTGNKWLDRTLGFIGDVALDPLTYVSFGSKHLASFGQKLAASGKLLDTGADAARAARLVREGSWFLTPAERADLGIRRAGVYFMGKRIAGTSTVGTAMERGLTATRLAVGDSYVGELFRKAFTPLEFKEAQLALKRGTMPTSEGAARAIRTILSRDAALAAQNATLEASTRSLQKIASDAAGIQAANKGVYLTQLAEDPALLAAATPEIQNVVNATRGWYDELYDQVDSATRQLTGDQQGVGYTKNYVSRIMTGEGRSYASKTESLANELGIPRSQLKTPGVFEARTLKPGGKFFGRVLTQDDMKISRLNQIANEGGFQGKFFEDDYFKILGGYATQHAREMGRVARFQYMKTNGVLDFVDQRIGADASAIADAVKAAVKPMNDVKDSMKRLNTALNDISTATRKGLGSVKQNATKGLARSNADVVVARAEQSAAVREVIDSANSLRQASEQLRTMFDPQQGIDLGIVDALNDNIDAMTASIQKRVNDFFAGSNAYREAADTVAENNRKIELLQGVLDDVNNEMEVLANNLYTSIHIHEILNTNINAIIDGKSLPISTKSLREGTEQQRMLGEAQAQIERGAKGGGAARGRPTKSAQVAKDAEVKRVQTGIASRVNESDWAKGVASVHPFQKSKVYTMTDAHRANILQKVAKGTVTAGDLNNVAMNIIARNEDFLARAGATMPDELVQLQAQLVDDLKELAQVRKMTKAELARATTSRKITSETEKAQTQLESLYEMQRQYDDFVIGREQLDERLDALRADSNANGADILEVQDAIDKADEILAKLEQSIVYVGEGATKYAYGIKPRPGLDYRVSETLPANIRSISDLEARIANLGRTELPGTDVAKVQRGQRRAVARAAVASKANEQITRRMAKTLERYYTATEVWRRATAVNDALAEIGLVADENMLRKIARNVARERRAIWFERSDRAIAADLELMKLDSMAVTAAETGNWKPLADTIEAIIANASSSPLSSFIKSGEAVIARDASFVTGAWSQFKSAETFYNTARKKAKVSEAFDIVDANREVIEMGDLTDLQRGALSAQLEDQIRAEGRLTSVEDAKAQLRSTSDALVSWYESSIGRMPKGSYKTINKVKVLTNEGKDFFEKFIAAEFKGTSEDVTRFLEAARTIVKDEQKLTRAMRLLFGGLEDPDANVYSILTGGRRGSTPMGMSMYYRREAKRVMDKLDEYRGAVTQRNVLRGQKGATTRRLETSRAELTASTTGEGIDQFNTVRATLPEQIATPETYGERAVAARRAALEPYAEGRSTVELDKAVRDRYAVNQQLSNIKSSGEYDLAQQAERRYSQLKDLAGRDLSNFDLGAVIGLPPGQLVLSAVEWESLFIADLSSKAKAAARVAAFDARTELVEKQGQLQRLTKAVGANAQFDEATRAGRVAARLRSEIQALQDDLTRAENVLNAHDKAVRNSAIEKINAFMQVERSGGLEEALKRVNAAAPLSSDVIANSRRTSLDAGWAAANERRLLQKVDDLSASAGAITTRSVKDEVGFLERRLYGVGTEENPATFSLLWRLDDASKRAGESLESARSGIAGILGTDFPKPISRLGAEDAARLTPAQIDELAKKAAEAGRRGQQSAEMRLAAQRTSVSEIPGWRDATRQAIEDLKDELYDPTMTIAALRAQNDRLAAVMKATAKQYTDNGEFGMTKLFKVLNPRSTAAKQRAALQTRLNRTLEKIAETADANITKEQAAAKRFAEAEAALGVARNSLVNAQQRHAANVVSLNERITAVDQLLAGAPKKITNPRDVQMIDELRDFSERAKVLASKQDVDILDTLWAEAEIANNVLMQNMDRAADANDLIAAARRGDVGGTMLPMIQDGWMRLGGYTDDELAALKSTRKTVKGKAAKAEFRPAPVFEAGFPGLQIPKEVGQWMTSLTRELGTPAKHAAFLDFLGQYTNFFKAYATLSPGFHVRNGLSNIFSVLSADANMINLRKAQKLWQKYVANPETWLEGLTKEQARKAEMALQAMYASGGGRIDDAVTEFMTQGSNRIYNNWLVRKSQKVGHKIESTHRFWLAYDSIEKGMDMSQASARVRRYLFDYHNPSSADEAMRRIIPFWTWMSRNLPLQLVNRWSNPRAYLVYNSLVRNYGQSTEGMAVPGYWTEQGAFRVAGNTFLQPDLGFNRINQQLAELGQPNRLLSYVNPLLRVPLELTGNTKLYSNQPFSEKPVELSGPLSALEPLLRILGQAQTNAEGKTVVSEKALYGLMNVLPPVSVGERLFPSTEQYGSKQAASWLSFLGAPIRQYNQNIEDRELWSRNYALRDFLEQQRNLGNIQ